MTRHHCGRAQGNGSPTTHWRRQRGLELLLRLSGCYDGEPDLITARTDLVLLQTPMIWASVNRLFRINPPWVED